MAGFFPHVGGNPSGFTARPVTTFDTILDDIVADVGAGVNGWTLHDDQRTPAGIVIVPTSIGSQIILGSNGVSLTNGSTAGTSATPGARLLRAWIPGVTEIAMRNAVGPIADAQYTLTGGWYPVSAVASDTAFTLGAAWANPTQSAVRTIMEKAFGFIVLKCASAQKTFYVQIIRPKSYGDLLRVQVFETWDAATHTGTNCSNQEIIRAYDSRFTGGKAVQYVLWLLPEVFALWGGADPANATGTNLWDFYYAGNLDPAVASDTDCLFAGGTEQSMSGYSVTSESAGNSPGDAGAAGQLLRSRSGVPWTFLDSNANGGPQWQTLAGIKPRGSPYVEDLWRALLTPDNKLELISIDVWQGLSGLVVTQGVAYEGRRGQLRHLRVPVGNPNGFHLATFGPAEDGHTYVMVRASRPYTRASNTLLAYDSQAQVAQSAFAYGASRTATTTGEIVTGSSSEPSRILRFFLLPIDV